MRKPHAHRLAARFALAVAAVLLCACAEIGVRALNSRPVAIDTHGVSFDLRPAITANNYRGICLLLDTLRYALRPPAARFEPRALADTSIVPLLEGGVMGPPIVLRAELVSNGNLVAHFPASSARPPTSRPSDTNVDSGVGGSYGISEEGLLEVCLANPPLTPGLSYQRLVISSSQPMTIVRINQSVWNVKH